MNLTIFLSFTVATMYNFFNSAFIGPGHVTKGWEPVSLHLLGVCSGVCVILLLKYFLHLHYKTVHFLKDIIKYSSVCFKLEVLSG